MKPTSDVESLKNRRAALASSTADRLRRPALGTSKGIGASANDLDALAADAAADQVRDERRRRRMLVQQLQEETGLGAILADMAERHELVALTTTTGRRRRGSVVTIGADFVALQEPSGAHRLVRLDAIAMVRTEPGVVALASGRSIEAGATMHAAVAELGASRPIVAVELVGSTALTGELTAVGSDVLTLRVDDEGSRRTANTQRCYVALTSVVELSETVSG